MKEESAGYAAALKPAPASILNMVIAGGPMTPTHFAAIVPIRRLWKTRKQSITSMGRSRFRRMRNAAAARISARMMRASSVDYPESPSAAVTKPV